MAHMFGSLVHSAFAVAVVFAAGSVSIAQQPKMLTPTDWEKLAVARLVDEHEKEYQPRSRSGNSWQYYNLAYAIDGSTALFEATGHWEHLDRALRYAEDAVASAIPSRRLKHSQFKDDYLGWPAFDHPSDKSIRGGEYPLFESYCWRYVARALRVARQSPAAWERTDVPERYAKLLAFTEKHLFDKWKSRGEDHLYRSHTHMAAHWAFIALELSVLTEDADRKRVCVEVYTKINTRLPNYKSSLRQQLRPHPVDGKAYFWASEWESFERPGQDVAHGNNVLAYVVEAHDLGVEFTDQDVAAFVRLLNGNLWRTDQTHRDGPFAAYVDGSGKGTGWFNDGFMKLGRYDRRLQSRLEGHQVGRGIQFFGNAALNAKRLSGKDDNAPRGK